MCMQCVAQSTPMVAVGLTVLRRRTVTAWFKARFARTARTGRDLGAESADVAHGADPRDRVPA